MLPTQATAKTMAEVVAERKKQMSPGKTFIEAIKADGRDASVEFPVTITDSLTSSRRKPRYPSRNMLKVVDLSRDPRQWYWHEALAEPSTDHERLRRELATHYYKSPIPELLPTTAWVQVPDGLWEDPETFESFINYRLIVRLSTTENETIMCGEHGLLNWPGIERIKSKKPFDSTIIAACDEVEQMGCTADGMIINPVDYYRYVENGPLMDKLESNGVFIVRTRLIEPGSALVGDFGHGAQLFDAGRTTMRFAEPPPGMFREPGIAIRAEIHERVVVNLPFTFYLVSL